MEYRKYWNGKRNGCDKLKTKRHETPICQYTALQPSHLQRMWQQPNHTTMATTNLDKLNAQLGKAGRSARNLSVGKRRIYQTSTEFSRQLSWIIIWGFLDDWDRIGIKGYDKSAGYLIYPFFAFWLKQRVGALGKTRFFLITRHFRFLSLCLWGIEWWRPLLWQEVLSKYTW